MRKAKIICTMGPASRDEPTLGKLVAAGMDWPRLHFSHGTLSDNKGINLPGTPVSIPALTDKDLVDLQFGLSQGVDYVAMSFVRSADDIRLIKRYAPTMPIIAKLEKPQAVDRIDEISQIADGVMIARGDLGVEMPLERVPLIQKTGIERTNYHGKIAIVATQMLESMIVPKPFESTDEMIANIAQTLVSAGDAMRGEAVIIASAVPPNRPTFGASMMQIHRL